jgi:hypothetical protein
MPAFGQQFTIVDGVADLGTVLNSSTTQSATAADLVETTLWQWTMPARTLATDGKAIRVTGFGQTANTANAKTMRLYLGATLLGALSTSTALANWHLNLTLIRAGAASQIYTLLAFAGGLANMSNLVNPTTENLATDLIIKITGQNGVAAASDIVFRGAVVERL